MIYVILPLEDVTTERLNASEQTSIETLRINKNGTKAILKFKDKVAFFNEFKSYVWYDKKEIQKELEKDEWA